MRPRTETQCLDEERHGLRRVARPAALVLLRSPVERLGGAVDYDSLAHRLIVGAAS